MLSLSRTKALSFHLPSQTVAHFKGEFRAAALIYQAGGGDSMLTSAVTLPSPAQSPVCTHCYKWKTLRMFSVKWIRRYFCPIKEVKVINFEKYFRIHIAQPNLFLKLLLERQCEIFFLSSWQLQNKFQKGLLKWQCVQKSQ